MQTTVETVQALASDLQHAVLCTNSGAVLCVVALCPVQVPNISRVEYTLLDVNEEGFVSTKHAAQLFTSSICRFQQQQPGRLGLATQPSAAATEADADTADTLQQLRPKQRHQGSILRLSLCAEAVSNSPSPCYSVP
jgi:hypothetical protein